MLLLAQGGGLPSWALEYGLPGIGLVVLGIVVRHLFKMREEDYKAERARADKYEQLVLRYVEDERKRYVELVEAMKTVSEVLIQLRADERRRS